MKTKISCSASQEIVLTCEKIAQSLLDNIIEFSLIREEWDSKFARDLILRINTVKINYLSFIPNTMLSANQQNVHEVLISSLIDVSLLHALIKVDFKDDITFQNHIFETLGFTEFFCEARNGDLCSIYQLLEVYRKNLTKELEAVITSKTINVKLLNKVLYFADKVNKYNYCIELTSRSKQISREACVEINKLYSIIKDICRTATAYFILDQIRREQFNFFAVLQNLEKPIVRMN